MQDEINRTLTQKLKALRISRSISQSEMDERAGLPRAATCKIETARREPTASELVRMARVVGAPLSSFSHEAPMVFSEETRIVEALRLIPFEDYQRILSMIETSVYYSSKDAGEDEKVKMESLVDILNKMRSTDSRPRTQVAEVKRVRK